jgi:hypothetical protein
VAQKERYEMFTLIERTGEPVTMRDGKPFTYTTYELAKIAARHIAADRGEKRPAKVVEQ